MPSVDLVRSSPISKTFRAAKVQGMFDIPAADTSDTRITAELPLDEKPWQIGVITGASGSGKSTISRELWPDQTVVADQFDWAGASLVDDFPENMTPQEITGLLASVGFGSAPAWLRPWRALSTGQQFRASLARALAEGRGGITVFDEYTSTVDRTVAKAVATATGKHVRRSPESQFVAVSCHKDFIPWLQPDWVLDLDGGDFTWGPVQPRPQVKVTVHDAARHMWPLFRGHHYLSGNLNKSSRAFVAFVELDGDEPRPAGFFAVLPAMGHKGWRRGHRTVVLPDFQGLGIGNRMVEAVVEQLWEREKLRFRSVTSAPGLVHHRRRHPEMWRLASGPKMNPPSGRTSRDNPVTSAGRLSTSWVYIPRSLRTPNVR